MYGMVKDDRHRTRAIASDGGEISISAHKRAFNLVTAIQDEVHRFSITYSRSKHRKSGLESVLTGIPGIGKMCIRDRPRGNPGCGMQSGRGKGSPWVIPEAVILPGQEERPSGQRIERQTKRTHRSVSFLRLHEVHAHLFRKP